MLLGGENGLLSDLYELGQSASTEGARVHTWRGLGRRLILLQRCRIWLRDECRKHERTVGPYVVTELAIRVNAYYVSLAGGLDNLAWLLLHELRLVDPVDETDRNTQRIATLTSKQFRRHLSAARPKVAARVEETLDWHWEIRKLRDPAAHRLPLTVVSGVMDENDHSEALRLQAEGSEALKTGDWHKGMGLINQASMLGKFRPWLENPEGYEQGFYYLPNLIARDEAFFVDLAGCVVSDLLEGSREGNRKPMSSTAPVLGQYLKRHEPYRSPWLERRD